MKAGNIIACLMNIVICKQVLLKCYINIHQLISTLISSVVKMCVTITDKQN